MNEYKHITVYTREGKQGLTVSEWIFSHINNRHRETGPAEVWSDGDVYYYLGGRHYSEENFYKKLREVDELPLSLALTHPEEWVRERAKNRK